VGRRDEMAALAAPMRLASGGDAAFALIGGEAGVGKTRLAGEFAAKASEAGFTVLVGHCIELGAEGLPLAPLVDALRALARSTPPAELAGLLGPARRGLARLLPELDPDAAAGPAADGVQAAQLLELALGLISGSARCSLSCSSSKICTGLISQPSSCLPSRSGHCATCRSCGWPRIAPTSCTGATRCGRC
jgi:predicted ATPase